MIVLLSYIFFFLQYLAHSPTTFLSLSTNSPTKLPSQSIYILFGQTQGTTYSIKYISTDSVVSKNEIEEQLTFIDQSLSLYNSQSLISSFNKSKKGIISDNHLKKVVSASLEIFDKSKHRFDITCKPLSEIWGFNNTSKILSPSSKLIYQTLRLVGSHNIHFKGDSLIKTNPFIKIDCDGIAQGYSVDILFNFLRNIGLSNFIVEIGGEVRSSGYNQDSKPWSVGLENPASSIDDIFLVNDIVEISNKAITTSGSYRKYKKIGNQYFSHIIDPVKGRPVNNGIIAVTVIAEDAMTADGWDNAFMVLGIKDSFKLLESMPDMGVNFIYRDKQGNVTDTCNTYFKNFLK